MSSPLRVVGGLDSHRARGWTSHEHVAVAVEGLTRHFGAKHALRGVELTIRAGEIHALLGPNGAGKTTLIRILCGLVDPHGGQVELAGRVGLVPSGDRTFYLRISGAENLIFFARLHGQRVAAARANAQEMLERVGLGDVQDLPVGRYSHGMQKRLSVARALLAEPAVLLVDEATHDLDPEGSRRIRQLITELSSRGTAILWTTQRIEEIRGFAHTVSFLREGRVRFCGTVDELIAMAPPARALRSASGVAEINRDRHAPVSSGALEEAFLALMGSAGQG